MKVIKVLFAFIFLVLIFKADALAVTVSITDFPSSISDQPFIITASVSGANAGTNYLRATLYKDGTNNYFGETYNGASWYSGGEGTSYFSIIIDSSKNGVGTFQAKIGTPNANDYLGSGIYKLKIRRYTSSGSEASSDSQTPVDITINYSSPTLTPVPSSTPTPGSINTPTSTNTPTPTRAPTTKPTKTPTPSKLPNVTSTASVLGQNTEGLTSEENDKKNLDSQNSNQLPENFLPLIFIALGIIFLVICAGIISYPYIKKIKEEKFGNE